MPGNDTENRIESPLWQPWLAACRELGVDVDEEQRLQLERFYALLTEANRTVNLTRITAPEDFLYRHLLDALTLVPLLNAGERLVDVGSGAGIPAIPIAILQPDVEVTAIESVGKKCTFMANVQQALNLENFTVLQERSEDVGRSPVHRERYDIAAARAVAALPVLLELCLPLVKPGGRFLAMKGISYEAELEASGKALKILGGRLDSVCQFDHPRLAGSRLLVFDKIASTPSAYPRTAGLPAKKPL